MTDWASYADHVACIDVTAERELPFEQLEGDPEGSGYVPRRPGIRWPPTALFTVDEL
ncbi:hypothetical protein [Jiangella mangrovi]|uniref:Uncharacterized protein n=1 Tax=Jiangella mangrovi TaxID=1524084 RepID=A0A7W9GL24_9ACTN|nr:hypothetical protein [Jiangella mangrovi]MBB5785840.1 hypothetical protein [Jiangella mangrovi]